MTGTARALLTAALLASGCAYSVRVDTPPPANVARPRPGPPVAIDYVGVRFGNAPADVSNELLLLLANRLRKSGLYESVYEYAVEHEAPPDAARVSLRIEQKEQLEGQASGMLKAMFIIYSVGLLDPLFPYHYGYEVRLEARFEPAGGAGRTYASSASGATSYSSLFSDPRQVGIDTRNAVLDRALELLMYEVAQDARAPAPD